MNGVISLNIQRAIMSKDMVPGSDINPYYVVAHGDRCYVSETCRKGNYSPKWNETFFLELSAGDTIVIEVMDGDDKV
jgi:Ca2+-dependent lipid-binding protein